MLCVASSCSCPAGYPGPRCQLTTRSFRGDGWAWYPPLQPCHQSHLSVEFITEVESGLLLYDGPVTPPKPHEEIISGECAGVTSIQAKY